MTTLIIKNKKSINKMRVAGKSLSGILFEVASLVVPGVTTFELDAFVEEKMLLQGLSPSCKGYAGYKHATCISINDGIVHGVPSKNIVLKIGDFVKIDTAGSYKGYCADLARYYFVEKVSPVVSKIAKAAQDSLDIAISKICPGINIGDISFCIQELVEKEGFSVIKDFAGHGVGRYLHELPEIPNYGKPGTGLLLREGMTIAIEPMISQWGCEVSIMDDGWTAKTKDGGISAHVEDTILVTSDGYEVLTRQ